MQSKNAGSENIARRALAEYGMAGHNFTFIRHSDSVTFEVEDTDSSPSLLRIHVPVSPTMGTHGSDARMVKAELMWLEALNRDTDLVLQSPVRKSAGELVTTIPTEASASPVNSTLLRWVDGQPYHRDLESEQTAFQIGKILATLHTHVSSWEIPEDFTRPKRDHAYFLSVVRAVQPAAEDGCICASDFAELERSIALLVRDSRVQARSRETYGIIHADGHKGNMLLHDGTIRLIDFSFCASGNFMFDLGVCFSDMKSHLHPACLEGYQNSRSLPDDYQWLIEGLFVATMVGTFSCRVENPRAQELLANKVPQIVRDYAAKFNRGESFWFS